MKMIRTFLAAVLVSVAVFAQNGPGLGTAQQGIDPVFIKLFDSYKGFSATAAISVQEEGNDSPTTLESTYEMSEGRCRVDLDLAKLKSEDMPAEALAQVKLLGMGELTTLVFPAEGMTYLIYPKLKAYAAISTPALKTVNKTGTEKLEEAVLGQEKVDGYTCIKKKVRATGQGGAKSELLVWAAKELNGFPIQVITKQDGSTVTIVFKNPRIEPPLPSRFVLPTDYTSYKDMQTLMQKEVAKRLTGGFGG